jgi:hypothetical protein
VCRFLKVVGSRRGKVCHGRCFAMRETASKRSVQRLSPVDLAAVAPSTGASAMTSSFPSKLRSSNLKAPSSQLHGTCYQTPTSSCAPILSAYSRAVQLGLFQLIRPALTHNPYAAPKYGIANIAFRAWLAYSGRRLRPRSPTRDLCFRRQILRTQRLAGCGFADHWRRLPGMPAP